MDQKKMTLMFRGQWESVNDQKYADIYYLMRTGSPAAMKIQIWKDLLKVKILEMEEGHLFSKRYSDNFDPNLSTYQNLKHIAEINDCLAFR